MPTSAIDGRVAHRRVRGTHASSPLVVEGTQPRRGSHLALSVHHCRHQARIANPRPGSLAAAASISARSLAVEVDAFDEAVEVHGCEAQPLRKDGRNRAVQPARETGVLLDHLWEYIQQECLLDEPVEFWGGVMLLRSLDRFFDRTLYFTVVGYQKAVKHELAA